MLCKQRDLLEEEGVIFCCYCSVDPRVPNGRKKIIVKPAFLSQYLLNVQPQPTYYGVPVLITLRCLASICSNVSHSGLRN